MISITEETLKIMKRAARRLEERYSEYRSRIEEDSDRKYTRVTAPIRGQMDHEGLSVLLPINCSKKYNGSINVFYEHCMRALGYVGNVEVTRYQGLVAMQVNAANIHNIHCLERRFLYYPRELANVQIVPSLEMIYLPSSAIPRPKREVNKMHTRPEELLSYGIKHNGFTTREAAEFLKLKVTAARGHIFKLRKKGLIEREGKRYVPTVDELPPSETTRDQILDYARKKHRFRLMYAARHLKVESPLLCHHIKRLTKTCMLRKIMPGLYEYVEGKEFVGNQADNNL
ncbi:MAG: hypothetical protein AABX14_04095 [Candidatus Aenigmatarchaeota archaeon]|mgnify:CR=1 FL=1